MKLRSNLGLLFCLTQSKVLVPRHFFTTAADLLQATIAFVLKIFSFSDKKKVLDFSTGIVGMQHAAAE